jgi:ATP-dependent DNA ligase
VKTKCFTESRFVVVGLDRELRALLAHPGSDGMSYAKAAFIALSGKSRERFFTELDRLTTSWAAFNTSRRNGVAWCRPQLAVEVKHLAGSKHLRHATVRRLVE